MKYFAFLFVLLGFNRNYAQAQEANGAARPWQVDAFIGRMLPHGVSVEDDIFPVYGGRLSMPIGGEKSSGGFFDAGIIAGNGTGISSWQDIFGGVSVQYVKSYTLNSGTSDITASLGYQLVAGTATFTQTT